MILNKKNPGTTCFSPTSPLLIHPNIRLVLIEIPQQHRSLRRSNFYENCEIQNVTLYFLFTFMLKWTKPTFLWVLFFNQSKISTVPDFRLIEKFFSRLDREGWNSAGKLSLLFFSQSCHVERPNVLGENKTKQIHISISMFSLQEWCAQPAVKFLTAVEVTLKNHKTPSFFFFVFPLFSYKRK